MAHQQPKDDPPRDRSNARRRRHPIGPAAAILVAGLTLVVGCSAGDDRGVADVTLPELDTTTTTLADRPTEPQRDLEPLPVLWTVQFGGEGDDSPRALTSRDESVYVAGSTTSAFLDPALAPDPGAVGIDGQPVPTVLAHSDVMAVLVDTAGEVDGLRHGGTPGEDTAAGVTTTGNEVLACGSTTGVLGGQHGGSSDPWCGLLGAGDEPVVEVLQFGGSDSEQITGVAGHDDQERLYVSGWSDGLLPGSQDPARRGLGNGDAFTVQLGPTGTPIWARQYGTTTRDAATAVTATADGDGIVVGTTEGDLGRVSAGGVDAWMTRFDPGGRQRWITQFGTPGTDELHAVAAVGEARRGTEVFVGVGTTDGLFGNGTLDDGSADSGSTEGTLPDRLAPSDGPAPNGEPPLGGTTTAFAAALGTDGTLLWTTMLGSDGVEQGAAVVGDGSTIYVAGTTSGSYGELDTDVGPGGGSDGFLAALDAASGEVRWVSRFGSDGDELVTSITTTEDGLLVIGGTTTGQMSDTDPAGGVDGFLIAFSLATAGGGAASSV